MNKHLQSGMSFIEVMIVLMIMGLFMAVVVPNAMKWLGRGRETTTKVSLNALQNAVEEYQMDVGQYPEDLESLINNTNGAENWHGPYLQKKKLPRDGWNQEFVYKVNPKGSQPPFELYSYGDPKQEDGKLYAE